MMTPLLLASYHQEYAALCFSHAEAAFRRIDSNTRNNWGGRDYARSQVEQGRADYRVEGFKARTGYATARALMGVDTPEALPYRVRYAGLPHNLLPYVRGKGFGPVVWLDPSGGLP